MLTNYRFKDEYDKYRYVPDDQIIRLLDRRLNECNYQLIIEDGLYTVWDWDNREFETTDLTELVYKVDELEQNYAIWKANNYNREDDLPF